MVRRLSALVAALMVYGLPSAVVVGIGPVTVGVGTGGLAPPAGAPQAKVSSTINTLERMAVLLGAVLRADGAPV